MKILLVNNHTVHINHLLSQLRGHEVEVQLYKPGIDFHQAGKDLIILSGGGGEGLEFHDEYEPGRLWYEDEMRLVRETDLPTLGICMGFEVIAGAYGAPITSAGGLIYGREGVELSGSAKHMLKASSLTQFEAHRWMVEDVPSGFEVLATSRRNGKKRGIEIFRYNKNGKKIFATQFHPEKGGTVNLEALITQAA